MEHGLFTQTPGAHLNGQGCKECKKEKLALFFRKNIDKVLEDFKKAHGNFYNYSEMKYINSHTKIDIICPTHGKFQQPPLDHLNGHGCPNCYQENRNKTTKEVVEEFIKVHGDEYDYSKVNYKDSRIPVTIICKRHGLFRQRTANHRYGHGCPNCSTGSFKPKLPAILYYILDITTNLYKIGITNRTVEERFGITKMKEIEVIKTWSFEIGADAHELEQFLHDELSEYQIINENFENNGKTEFFSHDVLNLKE